MTVTTQNGAPVLCHHLSLTSFRRLLRDYSLVCDSYSDAMAGSEPQKLEANDMGAGPFTTKHPSAALRTTAAEKRTIRFARRPTCSTMTSQKANAFRPIELWTFAVRGVSTRGHCPSPCRLRDTDRLNHMFNLPI
ncbi:MULTISPECIES: UPF0262 family protein [Rhizobium]|uniref:UPF0262 family protein n=1 Tax=Rhizobium TaxID=379 RepID=UPI002180A1C1|nr:MULTISPECIES: UPF0262 family protein [Rhizobium]